MTIVISEMIITKSKLLLGGTKLLLDRGGMISAPI